MTGALLPAGADAVVPVEWTDGGTAHGQRSAAPAEPGNAIRRAGGDAAAGDVLLTAGTRLGPVQIGLLAAAGHGTVTGPPPAADHRDLDRQRAHRARPAGRARPDLGVQQPHAGRGRAAGRLPGPPPPDRPGRQRRRCWPRSRTRWPTPTCWSPPAGSAWAASTTWSRRPCSDLGTVSVPQGRDAAGHAAGLRRGRPDRHPDLHPAGKPGQRVRLVPAVRQASGRCSCKTFGPERLAATPAVLSRAGPVPGGRRSYLLRGILDSAAGTVAPVSGQSSHQLASLARANALIIVPESVTELPEGDDRRRADAAMTGRSGCRARQLDAHRRRRARPGWSTCRART